MIIYISDNEKEVRKHYKDIDFVRENAHSLDSSVVMYTMKRLEFNSYKQALDFIHEHDFKETAVRTYDDHLKTYFIHYTTPSRLFIDAVKKRLEKDKLVIEQKLKDIDL